MNKVVVTLEEADLLELQAVLLDEDEKAAFAFLKERLVPKLPTKAMSACDSSYRNPYLWR